MVVLFRGMPYEEYIEWRDEGAKILLQNLKARMPELEELKKRTGGEDGIYRFYHQSFKVFYGPRNYSKMIVEVLQSLLPDYPLNDRFMEIYREGDKSFKNEMNDNWSAEVRPVVEAYFHARYMLEQAVTYGKKLEEPPTCLPSGWAALLYLYNIR